MLKITLLALLCAVDIVMCVYLIYAICANLPYTFWHVFAVGFAVARLVSYETERWYSKKELDTMNDLP